MYGWRNISTLTLLKIICNYNCGGLETSVHVHTKSRVWSVYSGINKGLETGFRWNWVYSYNSIKNAHVNVRKVPIAHCAHMWLQPKEELNKLTRWVLQDTNNSKVFSWTAGDSACMCLPCSQPPRTHDSVAVSYKLMPHVEVSTSCHMHPLGSCCCK